MIDGGLGKEFQKHLPRFHWQRIESGLTGLGIPDLNGCKNGIEFWIENKCVRVGHKIKFQPGQVGWIERRRRNGGKVFIAVRYQIPGGPRRGPAIDDIRLFSGNDVRALDTDPRGVRPLLSGQGGPSNWPWGLVESYLTSYQFLSFAGGDTNFGHDYL